MARHSFLKVKLKGLCNSPRWAFPPSRTTVHDNGGLVTLLHTFSLGQRFSGQLKSGFPWTLTVNQWAILAQVTSTELQVIKSAGKFGGRKLSQILWFCGYRRRFSLQNLECGVLQCIKSEQSVKVSRQKSYFLAIRESFLPRKLPAIQHWGAVYNLKCSNW